MTIPLPSGTVSQVMTVYRIMMDQSVVMLFLTVLPRFKTNLIKSVTIKL